MKTHETGISLRRQLAELVESEIPHLAWTGRGGMGTTDLNPRRVFRKRVGGDQRRASLKFGPSDGVEAGVLSSQALIAMTGRTLLLRSWIIVILLAPNALERGLSNSLARKPMFTRSIDESLDFLSCPALLSPMASDRSAHGS